MREGGTKTVWLGRAMDLEPGKPGTQITLSAGNVGSIIRGKPSNSLQVLFRVTAVVVTVVQQRGAGVSFSEWQTKMPRSASNEPINFLTR